VVERFENDFSRVIIVEAVVWRRRRLAACWFVVGRELVEVEDGEVTVEEKEREGVEVDMSAEFSFIDELTWNRGCLIYRV